MADWRVWFWRLVVTSWSAQFVGKQLSAFWAPRDVFLDLEPFSSRLDRLSAAAAATRKWSCRVVDVVTSFDHRGMEEDFAQHKQLHCKTLTNALEESTCKLLLCVSKRGLKFLSKVLRERTKWIQDGSYIPRTMGPSCYFSIQELFFIQGRDFQTCCWVYSA